MEPEQTSLGATPTANQSRRIAVLMLVVVVGTCLTLVAMAHSRRVQEWIRDVSWRQAKSKKLIPVFCMHNHFFDGEIACYTNSSLRPTIPTEESIFWERPA